MKLIDLPICVTDIDELQDALKTVSAIEKRVAELKLQAAAGTILQLFYDYPDIDALQFHDDGSRQTRLTSISALASDNAEIDGISELDELPEQLLGCGLAEDFFHMELDGGDELIRRASLAEQVAKLFNAASWDYPFAVFLRRFQ